MQLSPSMQLVLQLLLLQQEVEKDLVLQLSLWKVRMEGPASIIISKQSCVINSVPIYAFCRVSEDDDSPQSYADDDMYFAEDMDMDN